MFADAQNGESILLEGFADRCPNAECGWRQLSMKAVVAALYKGLSNSFLCVLYIPFHIEQLQTRLTCMAAVGALEVSLLSGA